MVLQAYLTGLDLTLFPSVKPDDIREAGLPPMAADSRVNISEIGCWSAHANVSIAVRYLALQPAPPVRPFVPSSLRVCS